jgi:glycosyltransferase involved in cell wall biosynthesis
VTVSTDTLAGRVRALFPAASVSVLYNSVFWSWRNNPELAIKQASPPPYVIAYMPGTRSHDRDFSLVAGPLQRFLRDHPDTVLRVTGPLNFKLDVPESQLVHEGLVPFDRYPMRFQGVWVNLAPLEQTPFNDCKSALKALEAGYMGVPTLCSPNPDMSRFIAAGAVVVEDGDWYGALTRLRDEAYYKSLTDGLRQRVLSIASVEAQAGRLLDIIVAMRQPRP